MNADIRLIIEDDEGKTTVYPFTGSEISIGRNEANAIRLMERNVSRRHARLRRSNGSVQIEDLDSFTGVRVNGERIRGALELREGDLVEIGDYHLALQQTAAVSGDFGPEQTWPRSGTGAGTVPDLRLPREILEATSAALGDTQDTLRPDTVTDADGSGPTLPPFAAEAPVDLSPDFPPPGDTGQESTKTVESRPPVAARRVLRRKTSEARLVCVSTQYAGQDFRLDRAEQVIGRVDDNDIVIEHRSVSRNHAKIVSDGDSFKIIDLQSANGILVNGEEYAVTDLRPSDLVELGHVRFRFLPPGVEFEPTPEERGAIAEAGVPLEGEEGEAFEEATRQVKAPGAAEDAETDPSRSAPAVGSPRMAVSTLLVFMVLAVAAGGVGFWAVSRYAGWGQAAGPALADDTHDRALEKLFEQAAYPAAAAYYERYQGQFQDPIRAAERYGMAKARSALPKAPAEEEKAAPAAPTPAAKSPAAAPAPKPAPAPPVAEAKPDDGAAREAARRRRRLQRERARAQAEEAYARGQRALFQNRVDEARNELNRCVRLANLPDCHRSLVTLHATNGDRVAAARHLRAYGRLRPDAPDLDNLKAFAAGAGAQ